MPDTKTIKGIRIEIDGEWARSSFLTPTTGITGLAHNKTGKPLRALTIQFSVYDSDGVKLADAAAVTMNMEVGGKWRFDAFFLSGADRSGRYHEVKIENVDRIYGE